MPWPPSGRQEGDEMTTNQDHDDYTPGFWRTLAVAFGVVGARVTKNTYGYSEEERKRFDRDHERDKRDGW